MTQPLPLKLPPGACNAHCHVFGPFGRFPLAADGTYKPAAAAPKEALYALNDGLGLQRCVVVQSGAHGFDNRAAEDAVLSRPETYRAVALVRPDVADAELQRLDRHGFRGVRFNYNAHLGKSTPMPDVIAFARRLVPLGWHLQIHCDRELLVEFAPLLRTSPVPVVIDHIGRVDAGAGLDQPQFRALLGLMAVERFWVKVSGMDRISRLGPPYLDARPYAAKLVAEFGDRVLWGNDWPHPNHTHVPDDRQLVDLIEGIAPTAEARERLLVGNPARLYRFGPLDIGPRA
jgi:2-pyrone-4,6-dicarboxylate lactonase